MNSVVAVFLYCKLRPFIQKTQTMELLYTTKINTETFQVYHVRLVNGQFALYCRLIFDLGKKKANSRKEF